jgi:hypothetical protein
MAVPVPPPQAPVLPAVHAEASVPLRPSHMDEAFEELDAVPPDDEPVVSGGTTP